MHKKTIVISLGGSLIAPNEVDVDFIKKFSELILSHSKKGINFFIITGGGSVARSYIEYAKNLNIKNTDDLDWIGIQATRLNAELLRSSFGDFAFSRIIMDPDIIPDTDKSIIIGAGWKPGNSSDLAAVHVANTVNSKNLINLSNIDFAYDTDPKKNPNAKPIHESNWKDFRALLPTEWDPGLNAPFDPIAAEKAQELGLEVVILNGNNLDNLNNYIEDRDFIGTRIKD